MAVIAFVSSKGGVGKTTSALVVAGVLAGLTKDLVTIVDADPNKPLKKWSELAGKPDNIAVVTDEAESRIVDIIDEASQSSRFVIVDLEGAATSRVSNAISMSNLVIIPVQGSGLDADQAVKTIRLILEAGKSQRRKIPYRVLFTRVPAMINSNNMKAIRGTLEEAGVPIMNTALIEREAFKAIFLHGGTVSGLDPEKVSGTDVALRNATAVTEEMVTTLAELAKQREVA
ncbi:ParA family protein [Caulobacter sp. X]|uniref:ParA family protein n=1 Tax=Caulobacter sp. X TaxID=2048901 RepID=UPI000C161EAE|nr:ParA family protein [Caulobacter sp. X]PIB95332.1 chromosome partitioning protein [Caulobacter sp. X]